MAGPKKPLFKGSIANGATAFCPVPIVQGCIGLHGTWPDATSTFTVVLEVSSFNPEEPGAGPEDAANARTWPAMPGVTITQTPGAAGSFLVNLSNIRQQRARLRMVGGGGVTSLAEIYHGIQDT